MINEMIASIRKIAEESKLRFVILVRIRFLIAYLIIIKYQCEQGVYTLEEVLKSHQLFDINPDVQRINRSLEDKCGPIHFILTNYLEISAKDLLIEFLDSFEKPLILSDAKTTLLKGIPENNYSYYDRTGSSNYVCPNNESSYFCFFKIFDEILGVHNSYLEEDTIHYENYQTLYLFDNTPKYRFIKDNNEYITITDAFHSLDHVILETSFNKISNFSDGKSVLKYLKTVILHQQKAFLFFEKNNDGQCISIINYDSNKIKDLDHLKTIIQNNRKIKDVLVKTNIQEIKDNHLRIGFQLYQLEKKQEIQDINKIVDENTEYLHSLNRINQTVEREINLLLNR